MIISVEGTTNIRGSVVNILAEFSCIAKSMVEALVEKADFTEEDAKNEVRDSLEVAFLTEEERDAKIDKLFKQRLKDILKTLEEDVEKDGVDNE